jgi:hypothetical protein
MRECYDSCEWEVNIPNSFHKKNNIKTFWPCWASDSDFGTSRWVMISKRSIRKCRKSIMTMFLEGETSWSCPGEHCHCQPGALELLGLWDLQAKSPRWAQPQVVKNWVLLDDQCIKFVVDVCGGNKLSELWLVVSFYLQWWIQITKKNTVQWVESTKQSSLLVSPTVQL